MTVARPHQVRVAAHRAWAAPVGKNQDRVIVTRAAVAVAFGDNQL
jgi:hypothetical protein